MGESYQNVVIGAGLGGLGAAAALARSGREVLVIEKQLGPGGYAHAFQRGPYTFDPAVHVTAKTGQGEVLQEVLEMLGVAGDCRFIGLDHYYEARFPGFSLTVSSGLERFQEVHARAFPGEAHRLARFFTLCRRVQVDLNRLGAQVALADLDDAVTRFPELFAYRRATVSAVLDEHFDDPRLKAALTALWPYLGLPPSRLSFIQFAQVLVSLADGPSSCEGGFENLARALARAVTDNGGEIRYGRSATGLQVAGGRVTGVRLDDQEVVRAGAVTSSIDARSTFLDLLGEANLPAAFARRLSRMTESVSAFIVFCATGQDPRAFTDAHEVFLYEDWDHDRTFADVLAGRPGGAWVSLPTLVDPSLCPPGEHLMVFTSLASYGANDWVAGKEAFSQNLLARFERAMPGLTRDLTFQEAASPITLERFCGNHRGAIYGWENSPRHTGSGRLSHLTPIRGLYLAGHWTHPGSGALRAIVSGVLTAMLVIARDGGDPGVLGAVGGLPPIPA